MALALNDRVQQQGTANTTVSFTLTSTVTGFQSFAVVGNGNTTYYSATDASGNWEVGIGTYSTTGPTLTRTTILSSSNSNLAVTFSGTVNVFVTYPSSKSINYDENGVATIGSTLSYSDTGIVGSFASTVAGYNQVIIQNKSSATNASTNFNVSNNTATSTQGYAELGINSSTFTGTGSFNIAGASYLASASTDLTIGTYGAYNVHFVTNSSTTDAMTIFNSGGVSLGGQPDPGIGTLYANNVYLGFNTITASGGTTVLTNASAGWQQVVGTTTHTIQLPNATTLYKGLAYTVANNSTGAVSIRNNASTLIDTTVNGGSSVLVLTDNATSAGTWVAYSYVPSTYDFSTTTANFGGATITNALWNGTTIGTGYGGTGLTTFAAANNAIYSTSSSALAAGTLPVAAGGTGATTLSGYVFGNGTSAFTASSTIPFSSVTGTVPTTQGGTGIITYTTGDIIYASATNTLAKLGIGSTGQVLTVSGGIPAWSTPASNVSSFQTSLSGLTPNTATTGAVTLAGTLGPTSGGTGLTTYAQGDLVYATATNTLGKLADVATGNALISGGVSADPSWGKIGLTTHVSGILPTANGGTNLSSFTSGGALYATSTSALTTGTLPVASGGTGQTTYTDGQLLIGNSTGNTLTKASLTAGTGISITPGSGSITIASTVTSGLTITNDTSTATALYPTFTSATSGSISGASVTSTKLTFVPSTGSLTAPQTVASNGIVVNSNTVSASYSIPSGSSATSAGPMTVASGVTVTVPSGSRWVVL